MSITEHLFITGPAGSGKSHMLLDVATDALDEGQAVYLVSPDNFRTYTSLTGHPRLAGHATTLAAVPGVLAAALEDMQHRRSSPALRPGVLVVVDDLARLTMEAPAPKKSGDLGPDIRNEIRARAMVALGRLVREGRAHGIQVAVAAQRTDSIPGEMLAHLSHRVLLTRDCGFPEHMVKPIFGPEHVAEAMQILRDQEPRPGAGASLMDDTMYIIVP